MSREVQSLAFEERTAREVSGPFGTRTADLHARVSGHPREESWRRDIVTARMNGERVRPEDYERLEGPEGRFDDRWLRAYLFSARLLARMMPEGRVIRGRLDGIRAVRFDVAPVPGTRTPIRRITVWMAADGSRLLRTFAVVERPRRNGLFAVTTAYRRVDGLDLPIRRRVEGSFQTKRRVRTFTHVMQVDSEFSNYRVDRR